MWSKNQLSLVCKNSEDQKNLGASGVYLLLSLTLIFSLVACAPGPTKPTRNSLSTNTPTPTEADILATATTQPTDTATPSPTETAPPTIAPTFDYFSHAFPLSENGFVIPLTVRHITENAATFFFELQSPADGILIYRNAETQSQGEITFSSEETRQMLTIVGLTVNTDYEAQIILNNESDGFQQPGFAGQAWDVIQFHTLPDQWPLRVGVLGDASFGDEATEALVKQIAAQNLDFVIHTGDVVYETDGSDVFNSYLHKFFEPFDPLLHQGPVYTVLGNHDYDSAVRWEGAPFYDYAFPPFPDSNFSYPEARRGNQYYAFTYRDIQFLMLDTHIFAGAEGRAEQDSWIEERLADPKFRLTIPVFHVAPYSSSIVHPDDGLPVRYSWNWRFENAHVPLVLSGHFHHYERLIANNITYIVSGGGSSTLYAQGDLLPESQIYARKTHFVLLEIYEEYIDLSTISLDGEIIDKATIPQK